MADIEQLENRLAVYTNWAFFGSFGLCLAISGFAVDHLLLGLAGFLTILLGFGVHLILNHIFKTEFRKTEVALALVVFSLSVLGFIGSWIFDPAFTGVGATIGLSGFSAIVLCFMAYIAVKYGVRGSYFLIQRMRQN